MAALSELTILDFGRADIEMGVVMAPGDLDGVWRECAFPGFLLTLDDGRRMLVDNGPNRRHITEPMYEYAGTSFGEVLKPRMTPADDPRHRLAEIGLTTDDIDTMIVTHCHFDHAGNTADFTSSRILIHADAYEDGCRRRENGQAGGLALTGEDGTPLRFERFTGDLTVADGVHLLETPGHAPGHISLHLELPSGHNVILAIDAIYSRFNQERGNYRIGNDVDAGKRSGQRLIDLATATNATLIYGHDPDQWPTLPKAPESWT